MNAEQTEYCFTALLEPAEEGGYVVVTCPSLPGLVTEGDTLEEARRMAEDAIVGYIESLLMDGRPVPVDEPKPHTPRIETILVAPRFGYRAATHAETA